MIQVNSVSKLYKRQYALHDITLEIKKGAIVGLVGQNGAGKTTLMRLIANLAMPTQGNICYSQNLLLKENGIERRNIGVLIDTPALYKELTAHENLEIIRMQRGIPGKKVIQGVLERVGLGDVGKKKVKNYSLGMKQRLAIGMAIMGNPEFIILDEPTNGLDPMGIMEIRDLIKRLNRELGITILVSSHQLAELYQVATEYIFIHKGRLLQQVSQGNLQDHLETKFHLQVTSIERAVQEINHNFPEIRVHVSSEKLGRLTLSGDMDLLPSITRVLHKANVIVERMQEEKQTLEDYFKSMIS